MMTKLEEMQEKLYEAEEMYVIHMGKADEWHKRVMLYITKIAQLKVNAGALK
jgi:hypothetical protein